MQALGVKIILFSKFTWADRGTEWFRSDLHRLAIKDPYGDYYLHPGYQYQTATQLLDINTKRLIPMCFFQRGVPGAVQPGIPRRRSTWARMGSCLTSACTTARRCCALTRNHGHRYGAPVFANDRKLIQNFHSVSDPVRKDFLFAGEACYDWEMDAYHLSYHRSENKQHIPLSRYLLPHGQFMTAVTGFNDRSMINQCLLYRYIISYEPYNFKGHLDDYPETMAYGKQMDALRTELREYFWDGEFRDTVGARVKNGAKAHHPYAVFLSAKTGRPGLVICNYAEKETITVTACAEDGAPLPATAWWMTRNGGKRRTASPSRPNQR